jgi:signal transduction histidine kinase
VATVSAIVPARVAEDEGDLLLAMVARALRTQLKPIDSGALVLQRRDLDPELARATARVIERKGQLLGWLIDELADIAEARLGTAQLQRRRVSMSAIVESSVETVTRCVSDSGQRIEVAISGERMELHADGPRLCQALRNLILNAAEASERGATIRVRAARDHGDCVVVVSDDGMGVAAIDLEDISGLRGTLARTKAGQEGGLGLGLYLARRFVEAHGGTLVAASPGVNRGSSFTLRLPCAPAQFEAAGFSAALTNA